MILARRIVPLLSARPVIVAVCAAAALAAGSYAADRPEPALARIRREGVVRIGYAPEAPYAFRTPDGRVTGESPEVARRVFSSLGVRRVQWVQTEFRALIPELRAGRFDVVAAGMYVTPERRRQIAFSRPTFVVRPGLLVRLGGRPAIRSLADVRRLPSARLAVLADADERRLARAAGIPPARTVEVPDPGTGVEAVRSGRADALLLSSPTLRRAAAGYPPGSLGVVSPLPDTFPPGVQSEGRGAFGFRPGDDALLRAFDAELGRLVGTPEHLRLVSRFGFGAGDLPPVAP